MKKFYVFAVAAATVCMMASCGGNKSEKAAEAQEAESTEEEVVEGTESPLADELLKEPKTFEATAFTLTAPAGWLVEGNDEESVDLCVPCQTGECKDVRAWVSSSSLDESIESGSYDGFVEQEPVQINGVDYRVVKKDENKMTIYRTAVGEGNLGIFCQYCDINDADVKAILESIVLK
jgi:hypothetical protein